MTLCRSTIWALAAAGAVGTGLTLMMVHGGAEGRVDQSANVGAAGADTQRAGVFMDDRRQQLSGVRIVPATRGTLRDTLHAVGAVSYDETRLSDINVKLEGWIRDLFVNFTGQ